MGSTPFTSLVGGIVGLILGWLTEHRVFGLLRAETVESGGKMVSTAELAASMSQVFFIAGAVFIGLGIVLFLMTSEAKRQRLAKLPRWQRMLYWPIESQIAPRTKKP